MFVSPDRDCRIYVHQQRSRACRTYLRSSEFEYIFGRWALARSAVSKIYSENRSRNRLVLCAGSTEERRRFGGSSAPSARSSRRRSPPGEQRRPPGALRERPGEQRRPRRLRENSHFADFRRIEARGALFDGYEGESRHQETRLYSR